MDARVNRKLSRPLLLLLGILLTVPACIFPVAGRAPSTPVSGQVETIIFETAAAARTQTAQSLPPTAAVSDTPTSTKTATPTPSPTATVLFLFPTNTLVVFPTNTPVSLSGGGGGSSSGNSTETSSSNEHNYQGSLNCSVVGQDPTDGTVFRPRKSFTVRWTIKNTGTAAWRKHTIDYRYFAGDKLHDKKTRYDMNFILDPGDTIDITVDMHAPKEPGNYETTWVVGLNKGSMCKMTLSIVVKK